MSLDTHCMVFRVFVRRAHQSRLPSCRKFTFLSFEPFAQNSWIAWTKSWRTSSKRDFLTLVAMFANLTSISSK